MSRRGSLVLAILDGWGIRAEKAGNAIALARTPHLDRCLAAFPSTVLKTAGEAVGLMPGQMGDSNVGHLNIGAGRIVYQDLLRISKAVENGELATNEAIRNGILAAKEKGSSVHLMGLLSDGGVHSHINHLFALMDACRQEGISQLFIHVFLDGRDVLPKSALKYIGMLQDKIRNDRFGVIATVMGRYYSMDRDNRWERVQEAYNALTRGVGLSAKNAEEAVGSAYKRGETDEFVAPTVIEDENGPTGKVTEGDTLIFFNFRADRAREITRAFTEDDLETLQRPAGKIPVHFVCMTEYAEDIQAPVAFPPEYLKNTLGEVLSKGGKTQLRVAETEKYAHVTFFFNGGREGAFPGEERILIPSPPVSTYDQKPEMSAYEVTDAVLEAMKKKYFDLIVVNYANLDMVGHTGKLWAGVKAVEAVDECIGRILQETEKQQGTLLLISDHGNAEYMIDTTTGKAFTAHTGAPVHGVLVDFAMRPGMHKEGILADVAPTILELLEMAQPEEMTGQSLIDTE